MHPKVNATLTKYFPPAELVERRLKVPIELVIEVVARDANISREDLLADHRREPIASLRQKAMYLCCKLTDHSLMGIARAFGKRDHTTILYARSTAQDRIDTNETYKKDVERLCRVISEVFEDLKQQACTDEGLLLALRQMR